MKFVYKNNGEAFTLTIKHIVPVVAHGKVYNFYGYNDEDAQAIVKMEDVTEIIETQIDYKQRIGGNGFYKNVEKIFKDCEEAGIKVTRYKE